MLYYRFSSLFSVSSGSFLVNYFGPMDSLFTLAMHFHSQLRQIWNFLSFSSAVLWTICDYLLFYGIKRMRIPKFNFRENIYILSGPKGSHKKVIFFSSPAIKASPPLIRRYKIMKDSIYIYIYMYIFHG